jgi:hypothetical protein
VSASRVLRSIANAIEILPGALGRLACGGLALLFVGGCTVVMIKHEPMYGVVLGAMALIALLPGTLRAIADGIERGALAAPKEPTEDDVRADRSLDEPTLDFGDPEEIEPMDFTEPEPPTRRP